MVGGRSAVATFHVDAPLTSGERVSLGEGAAHHARVRRLAAGEPVRLTNGRGARAGGILSRLAKSQLDVDVDAVEHVHALPAVHLLVPIGDRDRMLWLAEKVTELGVTSWQSVRFERSKSVSPRGEGQAFLEKVRARMIGALEQSHGAWLPEIGTEIDLSEALRLHHDATRLVLDVDGAPLLHLSRRVPVAIILGPEGGLSANEREGLAASGWLPVSLGVNTLRFETAAIAATAVVRAALQATWEG